MNVSSYFTDPDGDTLAYSATSGDTTVVTVSVSGDTVTVTPGAVGAAEITVTATDPGGLSATQAFWVGVNSNQRPQRRGKVSDTSVDVGGSVALVASGYFSDPDGDALTYSATSANTATATVSVSNDTVTVTGVAIGYANITITATDPGGLQATQRFQVTVNAQSCAATTQNPCLSINYGYVTQSIQTHGHDMPLVAGRKGLLRVFVTANQANSLVPAAVAKFYNGSTQIGTLSLIAPPSGIPLTVDESSLGNSFHAVVPDTLLPAGATVVVEIDPDTLLTLDPQSQKRFPATGNLTLGTVSVPDMELTIVPVLDVNMDSTIFSWVDSIAADTSDSEHVSLLRYAFPFNDFSVQTREAYTTTLDLTTSQRWTLLTELQAVRADENGTGHWYGTSTKIPGGVGQLGGWISIGDRHGDILAHEVGHNLSLNHAPYTYVPPQDRCGNAYNTPGWPYDDGSIQYWGWDSRDGTLKHPDYTPDVMGYCLEVAPNWLSDFHWKKALDYRNSSSYNQAAFSAGSVADQLVLSGGVFEGELVLRPVFNSRARMIRPPRTGPYAVEGLDERGATLFSLRFEPDVDKHGNKYFMLTVPANPAWRQRLSRIRLTGPERATELDEANAGSVTVVRDAFTGGIKAILQDWSGSLPSRLSTGKQVRTTHGLRGALDIR